jgi:hypothetical protein
LVKFRAIKFVFYWNEISPLGWNHEVSICTAFTLSATKKLNFFLKTSAFFWYYVSFFGKFTKKATCSATLWPYTELWCFDKLES